MMIHTFSWRDIGLVKRLEPVGVPLHPHYDHRGGRPPLQSALISGLPFSHSRTFVLDGDGTTAPGQGFLQAGLDPQHRESRLTYLSPALEGTPEAGRVWLRLLSYGCAELAAEGMVRFYAGLAESRADAQELFRQSGFSAYSRDESYARELDGKPPAAREGYRIRRQRRADEPSLSALFERVVPRPIQQAELPIMPSGRRLPYELREGYVLEGPAGIMAHLQIRPLEDRLSARLLSDEDPQGTEAVLDGLHRRAARRRKGWLEVYLPEYQAGVRPALLERGFRPRQSWTRLFKQAPVPVREWELRPAGQLERAKPTPTQFEELR